MRIEFFRVNAAYKVLAFGFRRLLNPLFSSISFDYSFFEALLWVSAAPSVIKWATALSLMIIASAIFPFIYNNSLLALLLVKLFVSAVHFKATDSICFIITFSCLLCNTALGLLHSFLAESLHTCLAFCFELLSSDAALTRHFHIAKSFHSLLLLRFNRLFSLDSEAFLTLFYALFWQFFGHYTKSLSPLHLFPFLFFYEFESFNRCGCFLKAWNLVFANAKSSLSELFTFLLA